MFMIHNTQYIDISITISTIQLYTGSLSGHTVHHLAGVQYTTGMIGNQEMLAAAEAGAATRCGLKYTTAINVCVHSATTLMPNKLHVTAAVQTMNVISSFHIRAIHSFTLMKHLPISTWKYQHFHHFHHFFRF